MAMKSIVFDCCPGCCLDWLVVETSSSFWAISEGREFPRRCPSNHLGLGSFTPRGLNFNWSTNDILIYCICIYMYNIYIYVYIYCITYTVYAYVLPHCISSLFSIYVHTIIGKYLYLWLFYYPFSLVASPLFLG